MVDSAILTRAAGLVEHIQRCESGRRLYRLMAQPWDGTMPPDGRPYPWQVEFMNAGAEAAERMMMAGNQTGKNTCAAAEVAMHATGWYPDWWKGRRFEREVEVLCASISAQFVRDGQQTDLLGPFLEGSREPSGIGWIPQETIGPVQFRQTGVNNTVDSVDVRHRCGKWSRIYFMAYEQGATKFQGFKRDCAWLDEEPDESSDQKMIYSEVQTRLVARGGIMIVTRTPLFGMTALIRHFMTGGDGIYYKNVTWDDAPHLTDREKARLIASYPDHEVDARTKGIPMMGEGAVYPISDADIVCEPFRIPPYYRRICGIDFGWDHPAAGVWLAHDADTDTVYLYDCYRMRKKEPAYHRQAIVSRGDWIPIAWPHDGINQEKSGGENLIGQYNLPAALAISARYDDEIGSSQKTEPIIQEVLERMSTGRFRVFRTCSAWLEEKRNYHRKDGKIVRVNDDLISASHYALMMLRYATTELSATMPRQRKTRHSHNPLAKFMKSA